MLVLPLSMRNQAIFVSDFNVKGGFMVRSEGGRICWDFKDLPRWVKKLGTFPAYKCLSGRTPKRAQTWIWRHLPQLHLPSLSLALKDPRSAGIELLPSEGKDHTFESVGCTNFSLLCRTMFALPTEIVTRSGWCE